MHQPLFNCLLINTYMKRSVLKPGPGYNAGMDLQYQTQTGAA